MSRYNTSDPEAVRIRRLMGYAQKKFRFTDLCFYDVISEEEVGLFERENGIRLPEDYKWFITNVGNGGMWGDENGSWRFEKLEDTFICRLKDSSEKIVCQKYALAVLSTGCSYYTALILTEENFGGITFTDGYNASEPRPLAVHSFKEYYTKWLEELCMGYDRTGFESRGFGTVEEELHKYKQSGDTEYLRDILSKVKFGALKEKTVRKLLVQFFAEKGYDNKRLLMCILSQLRYKGAMNIFREVCEPGYYADIVRSLYFGYRYVVNDYLRGYHAMDGAEQFYPMLVELAHSGELTKDARDRRDCSMLHYCLEMLLYNPLFRLEDIEDILSSEDERITCDVARLSAVRCQLSEETRKYIEAARERHYSSISKSQAE